MTALLRHHRADDLVAFGPAGSRTARELSRDAGKIAASLPESTPGSHALMVFESDRYAFAAALVGAWSAGHAALLPPDGRPQTIAALLARPDVACLLHDTRAGGEHYQVDAILNDPTRPCAQSRRGPFDQSGPLPTPLVTIFSAGATLFAPWQKSATQLLGEIELLVQALQITKGARFMVDVAPTHLHGLVLGLLLPMYTGGAFSRELLPSPDTVAQRIEAERPELWVSVPNRLQAALDCLDTADRALPRVLCGAAALPKATVHQLAEHAASVLELFGSTQTGTLAWRVPVHGERWQPLPQVNISVDSNERLCVDSPLLSADVRRPFITDDLAAPCAEGGFVHLGRVDEVVPTRDGHVMLPVLRAWLLERSDVRDVELTVVHPPDDDPMLLAAIVGVTSDAQTLHTQMVERFGLDALHCRTRVVEQLDREAIGRQPRRISLRLFGLADDGRPLTTRVPVDTPRRTNDGADELVTVGARIPSDYVHFEGHFDGYPILAAVVQLHELIVPLARRERPQLGELESLAQLKFLGRISPGDDVVVTLRFSSGAPTCDFEILRGTQRCSAGRLRFAPAAPREVA
jgi:hypothetical protein